jgi:hypothetical protein
MIGELPTPGVVIGACDSATCRLTEVGVGSVRIELAYFAPEGSDPSARLDEVFAGWWIAATFYDGTTIRAGYETDEEEWGESPPNPSVGESDTNFLWRESETTTDGRQLVTTVLLEVVGQSKIALISSGWERVGMTAGAVDVGRSLDFVDQRTTTDARPPGWLTYMACEIHPHDAGDVASYVMEWDWPSRLLRWIEVMPDGVLRARPPVSTPEAVPSAGPPTSEQVATASLPICIPIDAGSFDDFWALASTTGRLPERRHRRT